MKIRHCLSVGIYNLSKRLIWLNTVAALSHVSKKTLLGIATFLAVACAADGAVNCPNSIAQHGCPGWYSEWANKHPQAACRFFVNDNELMQHHCALVDTWTCPPGFVKFKRKCYHLDATERFRQDIINICTQMGVSMARPNEWAELEDLRSVIKVGTSTSPFNNQDWVLLNAEKKNNQWVWINPDEEINYSPESLPWDVNEPQNGNCVMMDAGRGLWRAVFCTQNTPRFNAVCEMTTPPIPNTALLQIDNPEPSDGEDVTMTCSTNSARVTEYTFFKNGNAFKTSTDNNHTLSHTSTSPANGEYKCVAIYGPVASEESAATVVKDPCIPNECIQCLYTDSDTCTNFEFSCGEGGVCDFCVPSMCEQGDCTQELSQPFPQHENRSFNFTCACPVGYEGPQCKLADDPCTAERKEQCRQYDPEGECVAKIQPGDNDWTCTCPNRKLEIGQSKDCSGEKSKEQKTFEFRRNLVMGTVVGVPTTAIVLAWLVYAIIECWEVGEQPELDRRPSPELTPSTVIDVEGSVKSKTNSGTRTSKGGKGGKKKTSSKGSQSNKSTKSGAGSSVTKSTVSTLDNGDSKEQITKSKVYSIRNTKRKQHEPQIEETSQRHTRGSQSAHAHVDDHIMTQSQQKPGYSSSFPFKNKRKNTETRTTPGGPIIFSENSKEQTKQSNLKHTTPHVKEENARGQSEYVHGPSEVTNATDQVLQERTKGHTQHYQGTSEITRPHESNFNKKQPYYTNNNAGIPVRSEQDTVTKNKLRQQQIVHAYPKRQGMDSQKKTVGHQSLKQTTTRSNVKGGSTTNTTKSHVKNVPSSVISASPNKVDKHSSKKVHPHPQIHKEPNKQAQMNKWSRAAVAWKRTKRPAVASTSTATQGKYSGNKTVDQHSTKGKQKQSKFHRPKGSMAAVVWTDPGRWIKSEERNDDGTMGTETNKETKIENIDEKHAPKKTTSALTHTSGRSLHSGKSYKSRSAKSGESDENKNGEKHN